MGLQFQHTSKYFDILYHLCAGLTTIGWRADSLECHSRDEPEGGRPVESPEGFPRGPAEPIDAHLASHYKADAAGERWRIA